MGLSATYEKLSRHLFDGVVDPGKSVLVVDSAEHIIKPE